MTNRDKFNTLSNDELSRFISFVFHYTRCDFAYWLEEQYDERTWEIFKELENPNRVE